MSCGLLVAVRYSILDLELWFASHCEIKILLICLVELWLASRCEVKVFLICLIRLLRVSSGILWAEEASRIARAHGASGTDKPMFMYLAFQSVRPAIHHLLISVLLSLSHITHHKALGYNL